MTVNTPPEIMLNFSAGTGAAEVRLLNAHPDGKTHYTTDGSAPTAASTAYNKPFEAAAGTVIKAVAVKPGLKPSPIVSFKIASKPVQPVITTDAAAFAAKVGQPFSATFTAKGEKIQWTIAGRVGESYRKFGTQSFNPPAHIPWLNIDKDKGVLSGTPRHPGVYPVLVCAWSMTGTDMRRRRGNVKADARLVVITVK